MDARLLVVSALHRKPILDIWKQCQQRNWPDCPLPIDVLAANPDVGWNANLILYLDSITESYVVLMLDDHFIDNSAAGDYSTNLGIALEIMDNTRDIGMIKLQAANAACPDMPFPGYDRLREYDRVHHPFKRTNLVPTLFRRTWVRRLSAAVLSHVGVDGDEARYGALAFEMKGTELTEDAVGWPERMLGVYRPGPSESCEHS